MDALKIYLGDLTHDTVGLAVETFPLNVGYIGAYCRKLFGEQVQLRLFKYPTRLERAVLDDPPDILALANYPWCHSLSMAMFDVLAKRRPEALRVMGGPNFPHDAPSQHRYLLDRPLLDAYVFFEGEMPFADLVAMTLDAHDLNEARERLRTRSIRGLAQLGHDERLLAVPETVRPRQLDEIPSPYLTGLLDEFFDGRLSPLVQTNRGCPFRCSFCHDGTALANKVNEFSLGRAIAELRYIGDRISDKVHTLHFSDLNFGMYKRDYEICAALADIRRTRGWPQKILASTGKNSKERIISALRQLEGSLNVTMSVQSITPDVLTHIKRDNIKLDQILDLAPTIRAANLLTGSEVILGLPGETKASHLDTLSQLLNAEMDNVVPYTLMMVNGSELASEQQRRKWEMVTKWRVIPRDFTRMADGRTVVETEEVVVATNTLSFEDYVACRKVALWVAVINNIGLRALLRFLIRNELKVMDLIERMVAAIDAAPEQGSGAAAPAKLVRLVRDFERETRDELWDREQDIFEYFAEPSRFQELVDGRRGANLMQTYRAAAFAHGYEDLAECAFHHARGMVRESNLNRAVAKQLAEVAKYCKGRGFNLLGADRLETVPETSLGYDISAWLAATDQPPLDQYRWSEPRKVRFILTDEQHRQVEDGLERYGNTLLGRGKFLIRIGTNTLWRQPIAVGAAEMAQVECL